MYVPRHGNIVWIDFEPHAGHEQAKERPALVLSEEIYNRRLWLAIMCPITTSRKPYRADLDVPIPPGVEIGRKLKKHPSKNPKQKHLASGQRSDLG